MPEYYAFQAALCFFIAHIFVRRGLVGSNTLTGSVISLGNATVTFSTFASFLVPLSLFRRRVAQCWSDPVFFFRAQCRHRRPSRLLGRLHSAIDNPLGSDFSTASRDAFMAVIVGALVTIVGTVLVATEK